MGPRVEIVVTSAGNGSAKLTLRGPIVMPSGISVLTDGNSTAERLSAQGITLRADPSASGIALLEVNWLDVSLLRFTRFQVEGGSGNVADYSVTVTGPIAASPVRIT